MTDNTNPARSALITTANNLRQCLADINRWGDDINRDLTLQAEDHCYGEVHEGFRLLMHSLFPNDGVLGRAAKIMDVMMDSDLGAEEAAKRVADDHAPMAGYSTSDIREELAKYEAWLRTLRDGVADPAKIAGNVEDSEAWLTERIAECRSALAYRYHNEPEVAGADS